MDVEVQRFEFSINLFQYSLEILEGIGFTGKVIKENKYPCTATAVDEKGNPMFFSNYRSYHGREKDTDTIPTDRNAVLVWLE